MVVSSVLIQQEGLDKNAFFDSIVEFANTRKDWTEGIKESGIDNQGEGRKYYREYEILDLDSTKIKVLAQVQKLDDDYYLLTLAYIEGELEENEKLAKTVIDSIQYSDVEKKGELELTEELSPLYQIDEFLIMNVSKDTSLQVDDITRKVEEYYANIPADMTLKDEEGYEYLMSRDIASADGNIYQIMVPKDLEVIDDYDKRFITYMNNGFIIGMYARLLMKEESLKDFLAVNSKEYECENPFYECTNIKKTDVMKCDDILYQICTAERYDYDGNLVPMAELKAAIPLGEGDALAFSIEMRYSDYNSETKKYLEELERYYGIPLMQFADLAEAYMDMK